ncbi:hypothetical protein QTP88_021354 [Uroleucon formosanum]
MQSSQQSKKSSTPYPHPMMNELKIISWNCNGIENKIPELTAFIKQNKTDIILLGETRLNPKKSISIPNYHIYRTDRPKAPTAPASGGTAILIRKKKIHQLISLPTTMESTTIQLKIKNKITQITAVYKSPSANLHHNDLNILTNHNGPFIIAEDLNSKHPSWNSLSTNTAGRKLLHHSEANNYTIIAPDSPTYYPYIPTHRPDVLDIILLDLPSIQYTVINHNDLSSDHNPIQLNLNASPISINPPKTLKKTNWTKFKTELSQIKINRVKTPEEIDSKIDKLTTIVRDAQENASYTLKPKQIISQLPDEIMLEITTKRPLRKMWQSSRDPRTKRLYNAQKTLNFKNKSLYQLNRRLLKKKAADTPLQTSTGHKIFEADEKAELFADTMENQFIGNAGIDLQEVNETITEINLDQTTSNTYINPKQVLDIINKLPNGKAPGYNNISNTALKNVPHNIITQLAHIFTACLRISYFPKIWKKATIVMIPKPGKNHSIPENHRPISLHSTISKVYEKIILKTLRIYIKPREEQHAFREDHSTTTQLFHLFKEIKNNQKQKKYTAATFLDMEKAFDHVWRDGLIYKLKTNTRLPINMIKLIKSFLSDRSFQVRVADQQSTTRQIQAGVPQGSCLSPLLYIQYVNDLPLLDKIQTSIFADDTMFHTAHINRNFAICQLQRQLDQTVIWIDRWRLKLNIEKTEAIIFGSRQNKHLRQIKIKNQTIKWKNQIKYLGVTMDSKLTMNGHTKTTTQKAKGVRASLYPILNQKSPIPLRTRIQLYTIYIKPILLYASVAWAPQLSQSNWRKLEAVQNIALRTITGA